MARKRIALTRRLDDAPAPREERQEARRDGGARDTRQRAGGAQRGGGGPGNGARSGGGAPRADTPPANSALADAFSRARRS